MSENLLPENTQNTFENREIDENPVDSLHNNGFIFNKVNLENDENPNESYKFNYRFNFFQILNEI